MDALDIDGACVSTPRFTRCAPWHASALRGGQQWRPFAGRLGLLAEVEFVGLDGGGEVAPVAGGDGERRAVRVL